MSKRPRTWAQIGNYDNWQAAKKRRFVAQTKGRPMTGLPMVRSPQWVPRVVGNPRAVTERKYFDSTVSVAVASCSTGWAGTLTNPTTLNTLFCPSLGDDYKDRNGRQVKVLAIKIKGFLETPEESGQATAEGPTLTRVILVQDNQTNAAALSPADVILSSAASGGVNMFQNPANFGRFQVLKDRVFNTTSRTGMAGVAGAFSIGGQALPFKITKKFKVPPVVHFNATNGGTIADIIDKSWHIMTGYQGDNAPSIAYKCRVVFCEDS